QDRGGAVCGGGERDPPWVAWRSPPVPGAFRRADPGPFTRAWTSSLWGVRAGAAPPVPAGLGTAHSPAPCDAGWELTAPFPRAARALGLPAFLAAHRFDACFGPRSRRDHGRPAIWRKRGVGPWLPGVDRAAELEQRPVRRDPTGDPQAVLRL